MSKYKVNVPLIIEADNEEDAQTNAVAAVAEVDKKEGVEFLLDSVADGDDIELLDEDNMADDEENADKEEEDNTEDDSDQESVV